MTKSYIRRFIQNKIQLGEKNFFKVPETNCSAMVIDALLYIRIFIRFNGEDFHTDHNSIDSAVEFLYNRYIDIAVERELNR